jgi:S1-C subfamily serine protease
MKQTQGYKRTLSGSVGAGLGSVFGSGGKQYYILEHKISSQYHRVGENQEIIVDQIEIGRDAKCQVRFDETFTTVSCRHVAIVKDSDKWKLVQLSETNPTFLNGNKVKHEWYLQNGDEIQLSIGGPKLGFLIPAGKTTGTMGFTHRLDLFGKQALRPYRLAIVLLSLFLLLAIGGGIGFGVWQQNNHEKEMQNIEKVIKGVTEKNKSLQILAEETAARRLQDSVKIANMPKIAPTQAMNDLIASVKKDIYFIETRSFIKADNEIHPLDVSYGTGFVLQNGYFVTARHCVETWLFDMEEESIAANAIATTYPNEATVYSEIRAYNKNGLQFTLHSSDFRINRNSDVVKQIDIDEDNQPIRFRFAYPDSYADERIGSRSMYAHDWAVARVSQKIATQSALVADYEASTSLRAGEEIHILGFPAGHGVGDGTQLVEPIYNKMSVSRDGLDNAGCILTSQGAAHGNSGGPIFALKNNHLVVVGIVSRLDGRTEQYNHIVPISQIKN